MSKRLESNLQLALLSASSKEAATAAILREVEIEVGIRVDESLHLLRGELEAADTCIEEKDQRIQSLLDDLRDLESRVVIAAHKPEPTSSLDDQRVVFIPVLRALIGTSKEQAVPLEELLGARPQRMLLGMNGADLTSFLRYLGERIEEKRDALARSKERVRA